MNAENLHETQKPREKAIAAALISGEDDLVSLDELKSLIESAGAEVAGDITQKREASAYALFGKGKIAEIRELIEQSGADILVVDNALSGSQMRNLSDETGVKVLDREGLILDVFAMRAATPEGKLQVELAQMKYNLGRLIGVRGRMEKYGGGIGMRGPGEKKLETDKRIIHARIDDLSQRIEKLGRERDLRRTRRNKSGEKTVALVGYTNAGKTTLLNLLSKDTQYAQDRLFATLDPVTRKVYAGDGKSYLLTDTVGFIRRLPHEFISAFSSTLEEARLADLLLIVLDMTAPDLAEQYEVVTDTLGKMNVDADKAAITVFNKHDAALGVAAVPSTRERIYVSARTGEGIGELQRLICKHLFE